MCHLDHRQLHLVTDPRLPRAQLLAVIRAAAENGADWIQVRDHQSSARELFDLAQAVVTLCRPRGVRVAVNDRIDVALAVGADGVQLGGRSLPVGVARELVGALSIGVSVHSIESAVQIEAGTIAPALAPFGLERLQATPSHAPS